jgi:hypothetical protein
MRGGVMANGEPARGAGRRLAASVESLLHERSLPVIAGVLSILLTLPALGNGWILDDYYHRTVLLGRSQLREWLGPPSEMFRFFRGDPERMGRVIDIGLFPWWTDPVLKAEMLHALTVLTHRLDYALWPDSPMLMHFHSILWLGAVVAGTAVFYRRMFGATRTAGIAALLYAVDDAHGATVGFLANRNALVAATFGVSALIAHDHARRDRSRPAVLMSPFLLLTALFSKEEGIGTCAYLGAYALCIDRAGWRRGCVALGPYAAVVFAWAALRGYWGYGVRDVGIYIDPLTDTARFFAAAAGRIPVLLLGQLSPIPGELAVVLAPAGVTLMVGCAVAFLAFVLFAMAPLLRRDRLARFWATGMVLAAVPVCATLAMDRLLIFPGIGAFGLLAQYLMFVFGEPGRALSIARWRGPALALAWFFVAVHAVIAPIALPLRAASPLGPRWVEEKLYVRTPLGPNAGDRMAVIVNAPSPGHAGYLILREELSGRPVPRHTRVLAPAIPSVTIRRLGERTLAIRPKGGYLRLALDQVFRSERKPLALGDRIRLTGTTITIASLTADGRPDEVAFAFDVPLESPSLLWLCFRGDRFEPFVPPPVGQAIEIRFDLKAMLLP